MQVVLLSLLLGVAITNAYISDLGSQKDSCSSPRVRKEWRTLSIQDRKDYIQAVQCLMNKEPISKDHFPIVRNRFEDFVALHANATAGGLSLINTTGLRSFAMNDTLREQMVNYGIHSAGIFLPWHRYALQIYENALRDECGWKHAHPYWNWNNDTPESGGNWTNSPIFDPVSGFGGNGKQLDIAHLRSQPRPHLDNLPDTFKGLSHADLAKLADLISKDEAARRGATGTGGGCIQDGPFKNLTLHIGPLGAMMPNASRCLTRNFNVSLAESSASLKSIRTILKAESFARLRHAVEAPLVGTGHAHGTGSVNLRGMSSSLHDVGHFGIGGEMADLFNSVNDPLFYLHHANIDRIWAIWQEKKMGRLMDADGGKPSMSSPSKVLVSLDSTIWMGFAAPDLVVRDVMDTQGRNNSGALCYQYDSYGEEYFL